MSEPFLPKRLAVAAYHKLPNAVNEAEAITAYLKEQGIDAPMGSLFDEDLRKRIKAREFDALVVTGGDGTLLRAGHLCAPVGVPVLGINTGRLGFLMQIERGEWMSAITQMLGGQAWIEQRMMLRVDHLRAGENIGVWYAINETVVCRGVLLKPVRFTVSVDERPLATYIADGLIAATPTGSTAYALAAGGPILPPELRNILLVPIAPHLSFDHAVVLAAGSMVSITARGESVVLSTDGQLPINLTEDDRVDVRAAEYSVPFIRFGDPGYFYRNLTNHMNQTGTPR
jgi:NAD+ kinase